MGRVLLLWATTWKKARTVERRIREFGVEEWDEIMTVNAKSVFLACQVFGKRLVEQGRGGSIINISSVSSVPPLFKVLIYSASKASVNNLTQSLALIAPHRVQVNAIIPVFFW